MNESAEVWDVHGLLSGEEKGDPREIEYDVIVHGALGDRVFTRVTPANRRIDGAIADILPARKGDPVVVCRRGENEVRFIIIEVPFVSSECVPT